MLLPQTLNQLLRSRQLEFGCNLPQSCKYRQRFSIRTHQSLRHPLAIVIDHQPKAVIKTLQLLTDESDLFKRPSLGGEVQNLLLAAMQNKRSGQTSQLVQSAGSCGLPTLPSALLTKMPLTKQFLIGVLIPSNGMIHRGQQGIQLIRPTVLHRCASEHPNGSQAGVPCKAQ